MYRQLNPNPSSLILFALLVFQSSTLILYVLNFYSSQNDYITAIPLVDPLNDFLHPDGKLYASIETSLQDTQGIKHMIEVILTSREARIPIF